MRGGFYDLNINVDRKAYNVEAVKSLLSMAYEIGYDTVAVSSLLDGDVLAAKTDSNQATIPLPLDISADDIGAPSRRSKFKVLHRLTVTIEDPAQTHKMATCENFKKYDILAAFPANEESFAACCTTLDIDIITIPPYMSHFYKSRPQIETAIKRGIFFEICYTPVIKVDSSRKNVLRTATEFLSVCKKNIIFSSFANVPLDIRGPYDVANLCLLFGLDPSEGIHTVSSNGRLVLLKAASRKLLKGAFQVLPTSTLPKVESGNVQSSTSVKNPLPLQEGASPKLPAKKKRRLMNRAENPTSIETPSKLPNNSSGNVQSNKSAENPKPLEEGASSQLPAKKKKKLRLRKPLKLKQLK